MTDPTPLPSTPLRDVALEVERHVDDAGWDQPPHLFALVPTADLIAAEPGLAADLAPGGDPQPGQLTPIAQEDVAPDGDLESALAAIAWPDAVAGCAAVVERVMLPPDAEDDLPDDPAEVARWAASHPDRREVRLVAAVLRDGSAHSAVRSRPLTPEDEPTELLEGPDLVPTLVEQLRQTFAD